MTMRGRLTSTLTAGALSLALTAPVAATADQSVPESIQVAVAEEAGEPWDPLEPVNRVLFGVNEYLMLLVVTPFAAPYYGVAPDEVKGGVDNFLSNLREPINFLNTILQGDFDQAQDTFARFLINSTIGVGGLMDPATDMGYEGRREDFGQTLAVWGFPELFYMVVPTMGPVYPRDLGGRFADSYASPWRYVAPDEFRDAVTYAGGVHGYAEVLPELEKVQKTSVDYYAAIRSMYTQKRRSEIVNGEIQTVPVIPDFSSVDDKAAPLAADVATPEVVDGVSAVSPWD